MTPLIGDFGRIGSQFLCPFGFPLGFPYFIICIYCYARTGYLRNQILSLGIPVFNTPLYICYLALVYPCSLRYRSECCAFELWFLFTPFSTKAPSYNQLFILLYVLNFCFRGRNTLPSLNYDLSIRLCMVGCYRLRWNLKILNFLFYNYKTDFSKIFKTFKWNLVNT